MSLQEGIAVLCARMGLQQALSRLALGRRTDVPAEPPQCPEPNIHSWRAVCGTSPEYSFPASAHTLSKPSARVSHPLMSRTHYSTCPERGREAGERPVCSVATSGCPTRSEDGFPAGARNIPPRTIQPKIKTPHHSVRGSGRAADGNRTRVSGLGSVRSTIELQPHLFQCIASACRG